MAHGKKMRKGTIAIGRDFLSCAEPVLMVNISSQSPSPMGSAIGRVNEASPNSSPANNQGLIDSELTPLMLANIAEANKSPNKLSVKMRPELVIW